MSSSKGTLLVLATSIISGFSIFLNKWGANNIEPYFFTFAKNLLVAIILSCLILFFLKRKEITNLSWKNIFSLILIGLIGGGVPFLLFFKGISLTSASHASFFHKSMFIWLIPISWIFLKDKIKSSELLAAIIMMLGSMIYFQYQPQSLNKGDLFILIAAIMWAIEIAISKKVLTNLNGFVVAWGRMFYGAIFILFFLIWQNQGLNLNLHYSLSQYSWILISAILLFSYVATFYNGLKSVSAFTASAILTIGAPLTSFLSYIFTQGRITQAQIIGIIVLFFGLSINLFAKKLWMIKKILVKN